MRARESVSGGLDGELSELERAWLDAHLRSCAGCSVWADEVAVATAELRRAPLARLERVPELPRRRRLVSARAAAAVTAAAAAVVVAGISAGGLLTPSGRAVATPILRERMTLKERQLDQLDREASSVPVARSVGPGGPDPGLGLSSSPRT
jgi:predicted anti-sigma-YlaC factor YlaD